MFVLQRAFSWGPASVKEAFRKSMKSFCDGVCKKRFKVSICGEDKRRRILPTRPWAYEPTALPTALPTAYPTT